MTASAVVVVVLAFAGWAFIFVPTRTGIWRRSWVTAAMLSVTSVAMLWHAGRLGDAIGGIDLEVVGVGAGVGVAWLVATQIGHALLCRFVPSFIEQVRDLYSIAAGDRRRDVLIAVLSLAVAEELVFRLVVQREFGLVAGVAVYAAVQIVERNWALVLAGVACGLVWGALYSWQQSLAAPLVAHVIWTISLTFVWPLRGCGGHRVPEADGIAITGGV
jgi:membrane protease YdiL (CAAX protease family)